MESNWTKAEFGSAKLEGVSGDQFRSNQETLARDLGIGFSAFLRTTVAAVYESGEQVLFDEFVNRESVAASGVVLLRQDQGRFLIQLDYSMLFPLIGIALGAKMGSFASPDRKPTDIELQVVNLLLRMVAAETCRSWGTMLKVQLDPAAVEIDPTPGRTFAGNEPVFLVRIGLTAGEYTGGLTLAAPAGMFSNLFAEELPPVEYAPESAKSIETALELLMPAKIRLDVWLDGSEMRLGDLLQLTEGQIVKLDHPVERKAVCTLNGKSSFAGQVVRTGTARAFMVEDPAS